MHEDYPEKSLKIDINDFLKYDENIWLHTDLIINAEDFLLEKNYRMCVIEANSAVETILFKVIAKHYNVFPANIKKEVSLNDLQKKRINDLNDYHILIDPNITNGKKWSDWKDKCQDLRNDVVHKRQKPDMNEADKALSSAKVPYRIIEKLSKDNFIIRIIISL